MEEMPQVCKTPVRSAPTGARLFKFSGDGVTSKKEIKIDVREAARGSGITFFVESPKHDEPVQIPAHADYVVNTLRNVVLGRDGARLCIVEHFLAAMALWGLEDLDVSVDGPEMPLGDGSAKFWIDMLKQSHVSRITELPGIDLPEAITITKGDRSLIAVPDTCFSATYLMDWNHPLIGKRWQSWSGGVPVEEISDARTFGSLKEHQMLGLTDDVVSLTDSGFTQPLRFEDEPVRHKILDLIGDLFLIGINPLRLNARFFSIKGGHEMDVQMAHKIRKAVI